MRESPPLIPLRGHESFLALFLLALIFLALPAGAQVDLEWTHGAAELHQAGSLVPFHARLENTAGEDLVVHLVGSWEKSPLVVRRRVELAAGVRKELDLYLGPAGPRTDFEVRLEDDDGKLLEQVLFTSVWVEPEVTVVGVLGRHPLGWGTLATGPRSHRSFDGKVAHLEPRNLPGLAEGLRVFDLLIWPNPDPGELTGEQTRALSRWVDGGGHLVLATNEPAEHAIRPWTSAGVVSAVAPRELTSLRAAFGGVPVPADEAVAAVALSPGRGEVWLDEPWGPLAVEERRGRGSVTVLGLDPSAPPVAGWTGLGRLWLEVLERRGLAALDNTRWSGPISEFGYAGNSFDLRSAARQVLTWGVSPRELPLWGLGVLFFLYLAVIGPGEYVLLRRFDRLSWTWWTFPLWVVLFSLVAYAVVASTKSDLGVARYVLIRDWPMGAGSFRDELHVGLFVTETADHRIASGSPEAMPLPTLDPYRQVASREVKVYDQGSSTIGGRLTKWSYLTGTFLSYTERRDERLEVEIGPPGPAEGRLREGRLVSRLGTDFAEAWVLLLVDGRLGRVDLGPVRDAQVVSFENLNAPELLELEVPARADISDFMRLLAFETGRGHIAADRPPMMPDRDPHPEHDWSSWLAAGGYVFLGRSRDDPSRLADLVHDAEGHADVIYRVAFGLEPSGTP